MTDPTEEKIQDALSQFNNSDSRNSPIVILRDALRRERERVRELERQTAILRSIVQAVGVVLETEGIRPDSPVGMMIKGVLSSDVGKHHLELDALKDRVVEASKYHCPCGISEMPGRGCSRCEDLSEALSALEAKEKEGVK